ncbi:MAG: HEPN domain-containing protein [Hespellia sp.]|nr:HEPN domain-containing protein [Hespellia sp.]
MDFKRHKDVVAHFNKEYVATGIFPREMGRRIGRLKTKREESDYDDFFVASKEEAQQQTETAEFVLPLIEDYLKKKNVL